MSRRATAALALALAASACVRDAIVARDPAADAAADAPGDDAARAGLVLQAVVSVTDRGERGELTAAVSVVLTAGGAPSTAEMSLTGGEREVSLAATGGGRFGATVDGYGAALALVVRAEGVTRTVPLGAQPAHALLQPVRGQRVPRGADVDLRWSPFGGAEASILSPGAPRVVADTGAAEVPPGAFGSATGSRPVRLQRATTTPLETFGEGSSLRTEIVRTVDVAVE